MSDDRPSIIVSDDKGRTLFRGAVVSLLGGLYFIGFLVMDRHNDTRYLQTTIYAADRAADKALADEKTKDLDEKLDAHGKWMEAISRQLGEVLNNRNSQTDTRKPSYVQDYAQPSGDQ